MEGLKDCETPFNWGISEQLALDFDKESSVEQEMTVINLIYCIMMSYVCTVQTDFNKALNHLCETDLIWSNFDLTILRFEGISWHLLTEIILGTKLNVLCAVEHFDEANKVLSEIKRNKLNKKEVNSNTLNGCKAIAWSFFHENGAEKAISFAELAIEHNPNSSLWHFILGQNLRRLRRKEVWCCQPSITELQSFVRAYELTKNPLYGIYVVLSYQENKDEEKASYYIIKVFETESTDWKIKLRLALYFLRSNDLDRAKICLDYVDENCSNKTLMFYHYKGIYYQKKNNYHLAAEYFKKASKDKNLGARIQYGRCMIKIDKDFSYIFHLLNLLHKFKTIDNYITQQLLLDVAMEYYHNENFEKALKYFIKGIKLLPNSKILQIYPSRFYDSKFNIYEFVNANLIPTFEQCAEVISEDILKDLKDFKLIQAQQYKAICTTVP